MGAPRVERMLATEGPHEDLRARKYMREFRETTPKGGKRGKRKS